MEDIRATLRRTLDEAIAGQINHAPSGTMPTFDIATFTVSFHTEPEELVEENQETESQETQDQEKSAKEVSTQRYNISLSAYVSPILCKVLFFFLRRPIQSFNIIIYLVE